MLEKRKISFRRVSPSPTPSSTLSTSSSSSILPSFLRRSPSNRTSTISLPYDVQHVTHISYDDTTGQFYGDNVPEHWKSVLAKEGISIEDQAENATATALVLKFYEDNMSVKGRPSADLGSVYERVSFQVGRSVVYVDNALCMLKPRSWISESTVRPTAKGRPRSPEQMTAEDDDDGDEGDSDAIDPNEPQFSMVDLHAAAARYNLASAPASTSTFQFTVTSVPARTNSNQEVDIREGPDVLGSLAGFVVQPSDLQFRASGSKVSGGFGDVRRAVYAKQGGGSKETVDVAVKKLRFWGDAAGGKNKKSLAREAVAWSGLAHPNIVPFIGYHFDEDKMEALLVCPWIRYGSAREYIAKQSPSMEERLSLILDAAEGLDYLHSLENPIVHGDIKAANVLVNSERRGMLCDFGLAKVLDPGVEGLTTTATTFKGSIPWCSPELFDEGKRSAASDIWAWGWLVWEVVTGKFPFEGESSPMALIFKIVAGKLPDLRKQPAFAQQGKLVEVVQWCWTANPRLRMTMSECIRALREQQTDGEAI